MQTLAMVKLDYRGSAIVREDRVRVWETSVLSPSSNEHPSVAAWAAFGDGPRARRSGRRRPDRPRDLGARAPLRPPPRHAPRRAPFRGTAPATPSCENLERIGARLTEQLGEWIDVHLVVPHAARPASVHWKGSLVCDGGGALHERYGARAECLYLVRPDGHVAYRAQPANDDALFAYLATVFRA